MDLGVRPARCFLCPWLVRGRTVGQGLRALVDNLELDGVDIPRRVVLVGGERRGERVWVERREGGNRAGALKGTFRPVVQRLWGGKQRRTRTWTSCRMIGAMRASGRGGGASGRERPRARRCAVAKACNGKRRAGRFGRRAGAGSKGASTASRRLGGGGVCVAQRGTRGGQAVTRHHSLRPSRHRSRGAGSEKQAPPWLAPESCAPRR